MQVWRPRLVVREGEMPFELEKGQHVLVSNGANDLWIQVLAFVKRNVYIGLVCNRIHNHFGKLLEFKHMNVLASA
jgi:hypothetical protein